MTKKLHTEGERMSGLESFQKGLLEKKTILKQIEDNKAAIQEVFQKFFSKREERDNVQNNLDNYRISLQSNPARQGKYEEGILARDREQLIVLGEAVDTLEEEKKALENKQNELQQKLADFQHEINTEDVLAYQKAVVEAQEKVNEIMVTINSQAALIAKANAVPHIIEKLKEKQEDLLAARAAGKNLKKALEDVAAEIENETKNIALREQSITEARKALSGLTRTLSAAKDELAMLKSQKQELLCMFLQCEAERIGKEYGEIALDLVEKYETLVALDMFISQHGGRTIKKSAFGKFTIPTFYLNSHKCLSSDKWPDEIAKALYSFTQDNQLAAIAREHERITGLGIEL